jgi:hypothetical protein
MTAASSQSPGSDRATPRGDPADQALVAGEGDDVGDLLLCPWTTRSFQSRTEGVHGRFSIRPLYEIVWAGYENKGRAWTPDDPYQHRNARLLSPRAAGRPSDNRKGE